MTIVVVLILLLLAFFAGMCFRPAEKWIQVELGDRFRGPNADSLYRGLVMEDGLYLFTVEACDVARERAAKHFPADHF